MNPGQMNLDPKAVEFRLGELRQELKTTEGLQTTKLQLAEQYDARAKDLHDSWNGSAVLKAKVVIPVVEIDRLRARVERHESALLDVRIVKLRREIEMLEKILNHETSPIFTS